MKEPATYRPFAAYLSRIFVVPPTLIFVRISYRLIVDPIHGITAKGIPMAEPNAVTDTRVMGAFSLAMAILIFYCVFSRSRLRQAHLMMILITGLVLVVRLAGFAMDGTTLAMEHENVKVFGEILFLLLNSIGLFLQTSRVKPAENQTPGKTA